MTEPIQMNFECPHCKAKFTEFMVKKVLVMYDDTIGPRHYLFFLTDCPNCFQPQFEPIWLEEAILMAETTKPGVTTV